MAVLFVAASVAKAQKLVVDVDESVDFRTFKSFGWSPGQIAPKATTSQFIINAIESELKARGLTRNDTAPDIRIVVMAAAGLDLQGIGPTWNNESYKSWGGYGNPAALMTVAKGTLLIDLLEATKNHSIWRGVAKDIFLVPTTGNLEKDARQMESLVNKSVGKMFKKYPVKAGK